MAAEDVGLVADIGRVSVRFGLTGGVMGLAPRDVRKFSTSEHATFTSALVAYLTEVGLRDAALPSVLAVAGAPRGDLINLTGSRWYISIAGVEAVLRHRPRALNECAANALALTTLPVSNFTPMRGPAPDILKPGGTYLAIGIGTGLGAAALMTVDGKLVPVQSEAGHMAFAAATPDEVKFAAWLRSRAMVPSAEALLSAQGFLNAYAALGSGSTPAKPEDVTRNTARDPAAQAAVGLFVEYLGSFVGDLVLAFGAWDGVFLTGSIARALHPQLSDPRFRRRMEDKGAFRRALSEVPVAVVNRSDLELVGAAAALAAAA